MGGVLGKGRGVPLNPTTPTPPSQPHHLKLKRALGYVEREQADEMAVYGFGEVEGGSHTIDTGTKKRRGVSGLGVKVKSEMGHLAIGQGLISYRLI